jgi:phage terminase large subunit GpA-like protein
MILPEHREALLAALPVRDRRPIWQIADGRYGMDRTRPAGERWQLSRTPWWKQPLDDFKDDAVREIVIMAGSQCSKTAGMLVALAWAVKHSPAPMLWITGNDDLAKDASQERVTPTLERSPDSAPLLLNNRLDKTTWKVRAKTCTIDIAGAQSSTALEQNPYRFVFGDEVRQWPQGSLQKVEKRQRSFSDAKRCFFSTPMLKGDEFHQRYLAGTQSEWVWPCMKCGAENRLEWKGLKYESEQAKSLVSEALPTGNTQNDGGVCVRCDCGHSHFDTPTVRRHIIEQGHWQAQNPTPAQGVVSYHWNALLPPWVRWADLVAEWKQATAMLKAGNPEPLKVFVCETLGEPWEEREVEADTAAIHKRVGDFTSAEEWTDELVTNGVPARVLAADVQQDCIYWRARRFGKNGASRGMGWGRVFTFDELAEVQKRMGIHSNLVAVDSGYRTQEVYQACVKSATWRTDQLGRQQWSGGWKPTKGEEGREHFTQDNVRQVFLRRWLDPHIGTGLAGRISIPFYLYADHSLQDMLEMQIRGQAGDWRIERDAGEDYAKQLWAEKRADKTGKLVWQERKQNHLRDCEKIVMVVAIASGILRA